MSGKTPGQAAYEAWWANRPPVTGGAIAIPADWDGERPEVRAQWKAAAQAAIAFKADCPVCAEVGGPHGIVTAGTEHAVRQLLDDRYPDGPHWQQVADMTAREG